MNAKDRYDGIIEGIEEAVQDYSDYSAKEIASDEAANLGLAPREFSAIMQFFTGSTAIDYIRRRKLMAAYKYLISNEKADIQTALSYTDYDNQSSFTTAFRKIFDMPPGGAMALKDQTKLEEALTWDIIAARARRLASRNAQVEKRDVRSIEEAVVEDDAWADSGNDAWSDAGVGSGAVGGAWTGAGSGDSNLIFGMPTAQFTILTHALDLCSVYGFNRAYGNIAYKVSKELSLSLEGAFEFVDSIFDYYDDFFIRHEINERKKYALYGLPEEYRSLVQLKTRDYFAPRIEMIAMDEMSQYLYFDCGLSVSLGQQTIARMEFDLCDAVELEDIRKLGPVFVEEFSTYEAMPYKYFRAAWDYYWAHAGEEYSKDDFDEYMRMVCDDVPFADAFETIYPMNTFLDDVEADLNNPIAWIEDPILDEQFGAEEATFEAWMEEPDPGEDISGYDYDEENVGWED